MINIIYITSSIPLGLPHLLLVDCRIFENGVFAKGFHGGAIIRDGHGIFTHTHFDLRVIYNIIISRREVVGLGVVREFTVGEVGEFFPFVSET
jgi:hypothetical protein